MTEAEVAQFLAASRKLQLATINKDGTPHLVAMYYVMLGGRIAFWTYRASQKALNLARDPRLTCLVESGEEYFDLCGVQVAGMPGDAVEDYVAHAARKRVGFIVEPARIASWDHSKLIPPASA